jgi:hypothetical protein
MNYFRENNRASVLKMVDALLDNDCDQILLTKDCEGVVIFNWNNRNWDGNRFALIDDEGKEVLN